MGDRIRVKINHHPVSYMGIALIINGVLVIIFPLISYVTKSEGLFIAYIVFMIVFLIVSAVAADRLSAVNGFLYADNEKLNFRYMKHEEDIFYSDIAEISYGTYTEYAGRYSKKRIFLKIKTADGKEHNFNNKINDQDIDAAFDVNSGCMTSLIRMYGFLAERMPEKAMGYVKSEKEKNL